MADTRNLEIEEGYLLLSFAAGAWEIVGFYASFASAHERVEKQFQADENLPKTLFGVNSQGLVLPVGRHMFILPIAGARMYTHFQKE